MARITPPPPLLLMLLLLVARNLEASPNTTLAPDCSADVVVKEGETRVVLTKDIHIFISIDRGWYVKPGSDIESVHFVVVGSDGTHHTAWFPVDGCFNNDEWWYFKVGTWLDYHPFGFVLRFVSGECWKGCQFNTAPPAYYSLTLVAHGTSSWRDDPPIDCEVKHPVNYDWPDSLLPCMEPPSSTLTPLPDITVMQTTQVMAIVVVVVVMVVGMVVAVLVVVCYKKCLASSNVVRFQFQTAAPSPHLQLTTGQGRTPDQDEDHIYYEILPDLSERRVVVPRPARDPEEPVHDVVMPERSVWPHSPVYENLPLPSGAASPNRLTEAQRVSESHIYDTVV